jgi:hypothetical protein
MKILTQLPFIYRKLTMGMGGGFGGGKSIPTFTKYAWLCLWSVMKIWWWKKLIDGKWGPFNPFIS